MNRDSLLHLLSAVSKATGAESLIVVGSQSAHGQVDWLPGAVTVSMTGRC